jgi:phospholipase/carboxylesterase
MKARQTPEGTASESGATSGPGTSGLPRLETVEVKTGEEPSAAIIWLHGLGADGHDFEPVVPHLLWPGAPAIRFVFPHAPMRAVTINGGMRMRAWYDILSISSERGHDETGILQSSGQVADLIEREQRRGIAPGRVILAGFSQGGAIAMHLALRYPHRLAGLVALSTYLLNASRAPAEAHALNQGLPIFIGHGTMDPLVPFSMGESAAHALRSWGYAVDWHTYPIAHSVSPEEIGHIAAWLRQRLG